MYQVSDVARLFGVSDTTIRNWVGKGKLKCRRLPSGVRVFEEEDVNRAYQKYLDSTEEAMVMWKSKHSKYPRELNKPIRHCILLCKVRSRTYSCITLR